MNGCRMKLIEDWKKGWKMWSVRLSALGASIMGMFLYFPEWSLYLYNAMPREIRDLLPDNFALFLAMVVFVGTALARIVKQEKLNKRTDKTDTPTNGPNPGE